MAYLRVRHESEEMTVEEIAEGAVVNAADYLTSKIDKQHKKHNKKKRKHKEGEYFFIALLVKTHRAKF